MNERAENEKAGNWTLTPNGTAACKTGDYFHPLQTSLPPLPPST